MCMYLCDYEATAGSKTPNETRSCACSSDDLWHISIFIGRLL